MIDKLKFYSRTVHTYYRSHIFTPLFNSKLHSTAKNDLLLRQNILFAPRVEISFPEGLLIQSTDILPPGHA